MSHEEDCPLLPSDGLLLCVHTERRGGESLFIVLTCVPLITGLATTLACRTPNCLGVDGLVAWAG